MKLISFRLDDITPEMNWEKFIIVKEILDKNNIKPLIGVVPHCLDKKLNIQSPKEDFWNIMRELQSQGWVIAQHGYEHLYKTKKSGILKINKRSEFAGLSFEEQHRKIILGKKELEKNDIYTEIFMAPAHSFDKNTIEALKISGFKYITDGYTSRIYEFNGIKFVPCMHSKPPIFFNGVATICLHTNSINEKTIKQIKRFIINNKDHIVDYSVLLNINKSHSLWKIEQSLNISKLIIFKTAYFIYNKLRFR